MKTYLDCMVCFVRQALDASRLLSDDEKIHEQVLREVLKQAATLDLTQTPPVMGQKIHQTIKRVLNNNDPYYQIKQKFTAFALGLEDKLQAKIDASEDKLSAAIKLSIAGNVIDFGVKSTIDEQEILQTIDDALNIDFDNGHIEQFKSHIKRADKILFLADNAGEIVFDKFLLKLLPREKVTIAVKSEPIINDATMEDAQAAGLTEIARVITSGSSAPGTVLAQCSQDFLREFDSADMIISKGQGNYETLSDVDRPIWFLLKAKCNVIAEHLNVPVGSFVLLPRQTNPKLMC